MWSDARLVRILAGTFDGMKRFAACGSLLLFCLSALEARAQASGTLLRVTVGDAATGVLLPNVHVLVRGTPLGGRTDMLGEVSIAGVPEGVHTIEARLLGYGALSTPARVSGRDTLRVTLLLLSNTQTLKPVTVRDSVSRFLAEFDNRRRKGGGHYITEADLRASAGRTLRDVVMAKLPGVRIDASGVVLSTRGPNNSRNKGGCPVAVWYNGVRGAVPIDFRSGPGADLVASNLLGGVEYYAPGNVPVQYRDGASSCGVMLLWSGS